MNCKNRFESKELNDHIPLARAAAQSPGRPHVSCVWRWCRKGVKARDGSRIRLEHIRVGGKIFTTQAWLDAFGRQLADADKAYFAAKDASVASLPDRDPSLGSPRDQQRARRAAAHLDSSRRQCEHDDIEADLDAEGL